MFRTVPVHPQQQSFYKLYVVFGIRGYVWLLCCYAAAAGDGMIQSETCKAYIEK